MDTSYDLYKIKYFDYDKQKTIKFYVAAQNFDEAFDAINEFRGGNTVIESIKLIDNPITIK